MTRPRHDKNGRRPQDSSIVQRASTATRESVSPSRRLHAAELETQRNSLSRTAAGTAIPVASPDCRLVADRCRCGGRRAGAYVAAAAQPTLRTPERAPTPRTWTSGNRPSPISTTQAPKQDGLDYYRTRAAALLGGVVLVLTDAEHMKASSRSAAPTFASMHE